MTQKKKPTKKTATNKKPATKKASAPKEETKTEAPKPVVISSSSTTVAPKVWESPKPFVPQKKKNWFKRLFG